MNDIYYASHFVVESEKAEIKEFVKKYKAFARKSPDMFTGLAMTL